MGSVGILHNLRCDCGGFVWNSIPHPMKLKCDTYGLCASCAAEKLHNTVSFKSAVSRTFATTVMPHICDEKLAAAELRSFLSPCLAASLWLRGFLRHHLLPRKHHSYFHELSFFHNGVSGSIDEHTDIIDKILMFL